MINQQFTAKVSQVTPEATYAQIDGTTYQLVADKTDEYVVGDSVTGFAYEDRAGVSKIQLDLPEVLTEPYSWCPVVEVRTDLGVFVDIGLDNKDIVVSLDDLPSLTSDWPKIDDQLYVQLEVDHKGRMWGHLAEDENLEPLFKPAPRQMMNLTVEARVYRLRLEGASCITTQGYRAFIHKSEWLTQPRLGEELTARVIHAKRDGTINLSTQPRAHEVIDDDAMMIQLILEKTPNHFLPLHDKSKPEEIRQQLGISKGQFKRAVGNLLKAGKIRQEIGQGIYLKDANDHDE